MNGKGLSEDMAAGNICNKFSNQDRDSFAEIPGEDSESLHTQKLN
jgi:hypothetical protein